MSQICTPYTYFLDHLADSSLNSLTLMESYRHIGLAFNAGLSFNLSINYIDRAIFKKKSDIVRHHCFPQRPSGLAVSFVAKVQIFHGARYICQYIIYY